MIEFKGVSKKFDDFVALDNIDLVVPKGTAFGLLGSNGAGKSTILRLISGIYKKDSGETLIEGENIFDNVKIKEKVFFINDETVQFGKYTLLELKNFYKAYYPKFDDELFFKLQERLNLPIKKKILTYSKGMKRQSAVILGLASNCEYLLLDEAFDGLDPTMRINVKQFLIDAMIDRELTVIISSHNLTEINEICDTAALIHKGEIIFNRALDELRGDIKKLQVSFDKDYTKEDFEPLKVLHFEKTGSLVFMIVKGNDELIDRVINEKSPKLFDKIPLTLEEVFIYEMEGKGYDFRNDK